jgi:hypothetical protein
MRTRSESQKADDKRQEAKCPAPFRRMRDHTSADRTGVSGGPKAGKSSAEIKSDHEKGYYSTQCEMMKDQRIRERTGPKEDQKTFRIAC